jgi:predicted NUDIX family NTP pyrophosphohydrolase
MAQVSAGVLAYRIRPEGPEFLLAHPGGPYWARQDEGAWSLPKGLVEEGEAHWDAAAREFAEELGAPIEGTPEPLAPVRLKSGKRIVAWLVEADFDPATLASNEFEMEWPPRSGRMRRFPEVDRAQWFDPPTALIKIHPGQRPLLEEAIAKLAG